MMPGVQFEEVWKTFSAGFTKRSLAQLLRIRLDKDLYSLIDEGAMRDIVFDLLLRAEREGWTTDLIREAFLYNPTNPDLQRIYQKYGFAPALSTQEAGAAVPDVRSVTEGLEKAIRDRMPRFDFAIWRERMSQVEGRVCRVEIDGRATGTGFLVGPDAILTAYHVLKSVFADRSVAPRVVCRFDYKVLADGNQVPGVEARLHPIDWLLDFSPYSPAELTRTPDNPPPAADELDYALVRLAGRLGDESVTPTGGAEAPRRGWLPIPAGAPVFVPKMPLIIAQHPEGRPLKLAVDTQAVIGMNAPGTRIRYATNTERGASGAPVFDLNWNLVALHQHGDPGFDLPPAYNQGVPINRIRDRIAAAGKASVLGGDPN